MHLVTIIVRSTVLSKRKTYWDFPGGPLVKNLPANAGHTGCIPSLERLDMPWDNYAHELPLLSPLAVTTRSCNKRSHGKKKLIDHNKRKPEHSNEDAAQPKISKITHF